MKGPHGFESHPHRVWRVGPERLYGTRLESERRRKAWLWIMATAFVVVFLIHQRRNRVAARALLGSFKGTLGSDRWTAYHVHTGRRQICWSHLERDFHAMSEYKGKAGRIG